MFTYFCLTCLVMSLWSGKPTEQTLAVNLSLASLWPYSTGLSCWEDRGDHDDLVELGQRQVLKCEQNRWRFGGLAQCSSCWKGVCTAADTLNGTWCKDVNMQRRLTFALRVWGSVTSDWPVNNSETYWSGQSWHKGSRTWRMARVCFVFAGGVTLPLPGCFCLPTTCSHVRVKDRAPVSFRRPGLHLSIPMSLAVLH